MKYQGRHSSSQYDTYIQYGHNANQVLNYYVYLENDNWNWRNLYGPLTKVKRSEVAKFTLQSNQYF